MTEEEIDEKRKLTNTTYVLTENIHIPLCQYDIDYPNHMNTTILRRLGGEIDILNQKRAELEQELWELKQTVYDNHSRRHEP